MPPSTGGHHCGEKSKARIAEPVRHLLPPSTGGLHCGALAVDRCPKNASFSRLLLAGSIAAFCLFSLPFRHCSFSRLLLAGSIAASFGCFRATWATWAFPPFYWRGPLRPLFTAGPAPPVHAFPPFLPPRPLRASLLCA